MADRRADGSRQTTDRRQIEQTEVKYFQLFWEILKTVTVSDRKYTEMYQTMYEIDNVKYRKLLLL